MTDQTAGLWNKLSQLPVPAPPAVRPPPVQSHSGRHPGPRAHSGFPEAAGGHRHQGSGLPAGHPHLLAERAAGQAGAKRVPSPGTVGGGPAGDAALSHRKGPCRGAARAGAKRRVGLPLSGRNRSTLAAIWDRDHRRPGRRSWGRATAVGTRNASGGIGGL